MHRVIFLVLLLVPTFAAAQTICLDPGHPSENGVGTKGKKLTEVFVVWDVAQRLEKLLKAEGYKVVMTKSKERHRVDNRTRAKIANESKVDLMLRLHCDAGTGSGFALYHPGRMGRVAGTRGPSQIVIDMSRKAAKAFHGPFAKALKGKLADGGVHTDGKTAIGSRQGALTGSIYAKVPVLLVELCVLQNRRDEAYVALPAHRDEVALALLKGIIGAVPRRVKTP